MRRPALGGTGCSDNVQQAVYNHPVVTRALAPFTALALAVYVLAGAGASVADPRDHRDEARQDAPRDHPGEARGEPRGGYYGRPEEQRFGGQPAYAPQPYGARRGYPGVAPAGRGPNSLGADWREQQEEARFGVNQGRLTPLSRVIDGIARRTPGRQLDSGIEYIGDRAVYRVRWMTHDGRRIDYLVDAATGTIVGEH